MSCRFCGTEQHTVRVVASNATVTYACGTAFFPTDHELGEPFDSCWSQSPECKAKAPVKDNGKRAMSPTEAESAMRSHLEAEYMDRLQLENATLRETLENERKFSAASREAHAKAMARIAALEAEAMQARDDEAWARGKIMPVDFAPVESGWEAGWWEARWWDGEKKISATAPTIHAALRALREKVEGGAR